MSDIREQPDDLPHLLVKLLDDVLDASEQQQLAEMLRHDPNARETYLDYVLFHSYLRAQHSLLPAECSPECGPKLPCPVDGVVPATEFHAGLPVSNSLGVSLHGTVGYFSSGWPVAYLVATVVLGVGLLIGASMHVSAPLQVAKHSAPAFSPLVPSRSSHMEFVGRITGMLDCQWADPNTAVPGPVAVPLGRKYALSSGLLEITYDTGAKVILQGPCTYEVESPVGGFLTLGKLTAIVEKKDHLPSPFGRGEGGEGQKDGNRGASQPALTLTLSQRERGPDTHSSFLIPHSYFAVRTPTATVTDLGTEFGVEVSKQGNTTSHVFRGSVSLQVAGGDKGTSVAPLVLRENESARVEQSGDTRVIVSDPSAKPAEFVRKLVKPIIKTFDLVDVVAGGDGFSGRRNRGIDPRDGRAINTEEIGNPTIGDGEYHRVAGMPFLDGIFIPHSNGGPVQLDSAGHAFSEFPATDNKTCSALWAGQCGNDSAELGGTNYASPGHGLLAIDANQGVTFDLEAIRRANPDSTLVRFRAVAGNAECVSEQGVLVWADAWVFVDGQVRFRRREINRFNGAMPIIIPINDKDRFLTLVATDGGNGYQQDHILFGDPQLEMVPAKAAADATPPREAAEP